MHRWTKEDVCWWLESQDLGKHQQVFFEQAITGETLVDLTMEELKVDLGVTALGDRKKLLDLIRRHRQWTSPKNALEAPAACEEDRGEHSARSSASSCDQPAVVHYDWGGDCQQDQQEQQLGQEQEQVQEQVQAPYQAQSPSHHHAQQPASPSPGPGPVPCAGPGPGFGPGSGKCKSEAALATFHPSHALPAQSTSTTPQMSLPRFNVKSFYSNTQPAPMAGLPAGADMAYRYNIKPASFLNPSDPPGLPASAHGHQGRPPSTPAAALGGFSACPAASEVNCSPETGGGRQASGVVGYAVPSQQGQPGGMSFSKSLSAALLPCEAIVEADVFESTCRVTVPNPAVAERLRSQGICLNGGHAATFLTDCTAFFLSNIPGGLDKDEMGAEVAKATSVEVKHCAVKENGTGILLVATEPDAHKLMCMLGELPVCGDVVHLSDEPCFPVYLEGLADQVRRGDVVKAFQQVDLMPKCVWLKDGKANVLMKDMNDCYQALTRPITLQGFPLRILHIRGTCVPFSNSWYETAIPDLPRIDEIPHGDPVFRAAGGTWNAQLWLKHFEKCKDSDRQLHGMRRAAMIPTMQACRQGEYTVHVQHSASASWHHSHLQSQAQVVKVEQPPETRFYNLEEGDLTKPKSARIRFRNQFARVSVKKQDCLLVAREIQRSTGETPLVLNMASSMHPGGGYLAGDGAQEETLFRRSNYYRTLSSLDDCKGPKYPWPGKYCAAFSPGVTVFRGPEQEGYPFLKEPFKVDFVAVAALRKPRLQTNTLLTRENAAISRRIVELLFLVGLQQQQHRKHHLVLSALGCGAYQNPPEHVAEIFKAVLMQYGYMFQTITFAIVEDHNSGDGNFWPFFKVLHNLPPPPQLPYMSPDAADPAVPCHFQGCCKNRDNPAHCNKFGHPPLCPWSPNCSEPGPVHEHLFTHRQQCEQGGECTRQKDQAHTELFDHPPECPQGASCLCNDPKHLKSLTHSVPICSKGIACPKRSEKGHSSSFRHPVLPCKHGSACYNLDRQHRMESGHDGLLPVCPRAIGCSDEDKDHKMNFSHICPHGTSCTEMCDPDHSKHFIHLSREPCKHGGECSKVHDIGHLANFNHSAIAGNLEWPRKECRHGVDCKDFDMKHRCEFVHPSLSLTMQPCEVRGLLKGLDLHSSRSFLMGGLGRSPKATRPEAVADEIVEWVKQLRPQHRCQLPVFESICAHGVLMSASHMKQLNQKEAAIRAAQSHPEVLAALKDLPEAQHRHVSDHVANLVTLEYSQPSNGVHLAGPPLSARPAPCAEAEKAEKKLNESANILDSLKVNRATRTKIEEMAREVAKNSKRLEQQPVGIHYKGDISMKTDRHIFSIVGPHTGYRYGGIVLMLKPEIMHHPDFFLTVGAATSYRSGRVSQLRPWCATNPAGMQPTPEAQAQNLKVFEQSALHPCVYQWERIVAAELASMTAENLGLHGSIKLKDVHKFWSTCHSHDVIEGHLPSVVPLSYVERILVPQDERLSTKTLDVLKSCFGEEGLKEVLKLGDISTSEQKVGGRPAAFKRTHITPSLKQKQLQARLHGIVASLSGGMAEKQEEAVLPLVLSPSHELSHLYLSVPSADNSGNPTELFVTLKPSGSRDAKRAVHIFLTAGLGQDRASHITTALPAAHEAVLKDQKQQLASAHFNPGPWPNGEVSYHVQLDANSRTVKVMHAGLCARLYPSEMKAECPLPFDSKIQVSLSTRIGGVCVTGITVRKEPLPLPALTGTREASSSLRSWHFGLASVLRSWMPGSPSAPQGTSQPPKWQWEGDNGWSDFEEVSCQKLEDACIKKENGLRLRVEGSDFDVDLVRMTQRNVTTGKCDKIRRCGAADQDATPEKAIWQVELDSGWEDLDKVVSRILNQEEARGRKTARFQHRRMEYEINFDQMLQTNLGSKRSRKVRKLTLDAKPHSQRDKQGTGEHSNEQPSFSSSSLPDRRAERVRLWQVCTGPGTWANMDQEVSRQLEVAQAANKSTCRFSLKGEDYELDFCRGIQVNLKTNKERAVRAP